MARFRPSLRPIVGLKHIVETSSVTAATTNTVGLNLLTGVDQYGLADADGVPAGARVNSVFVSIFIISEGGEIATEVPLVDWYFLCDKGGAYGTTFNSTSLPTPGATGIHLNKSAILHTEKGLSGGGDASLAGVPMITKMVVKIPPKFRRIQNNDLWKINLRTNFNSKFCIQCIYKHYE